MQDPVSSTLGSRSLLRPPPNLRCCLIFLKAPSEAKGGGGLDGGLDPGRRGPEELGLRRPESTVGLPAVSGAGLKAECGGRGGRRGRRLGRRRQWWHAGRWRGRHEERRRGFFFSRVAEAAGVAARHGARRALK